MKKVFALILAICLLSGCTGKTSLPNNNASETSEAASSVSSESASSEKAKTDNSVDFVVVDDIKYYKDYKILINGEWYPVPKNKKETHSANVPEFGLNGRILLYMADYPMDAVDEYCELVDAIMEYYAVAENVEPRWDDISIGKKEIGRKIKNEAGEQIGSEFYTEITIAFRHGVARLTYSLDDLELSRAMFEVMHDQNRNLFGLTPEQVELFIDPDQITALESNIKTVAKKLEIDPERALNKK